MPGPLHSESKEARANVLDKLRAWGRVALFAALILGPAGVMAGVNKPVLERGKGERCVEDTEFMRRNHMVLLKHHRDETMRRGIRTTKHSLKGCVDCHASSKTGSVAASKDDFCMACHVYSGVKLDCWDCHATKPLEQYKASRPPRSARMTTQPIAGAQP